MSRNKELAQKLKEHEGYQRPIIAFKLTDEEPQNAECYGDDMSFLCAIVAEVYEGRKPLYITNKNIICGGAVYSGLGQRPVVKEEFDMGMEGTTIGLNCAYASRQVFRRVNQQIKHFYKHHHYMIIGALEDMDDYDMVMITADANKIMRLCKVYTWATGELTHGLTGTAWCANSFPLLYRDGGLTYNMGDPPSRVLMNLDGGEMFGFVHRNTLELIVENFKNNSDGNVM